MKMTTSAPAQVLRKLLVGRLTCEAFEKDGQRGYRFTGQGTYEHLLPGKLVPTWVVTPAGFDTFGLVENRGIVRVA